MRWTEWRWRCANVVGDKGGVGGCQGSLTVGCSLGLEAGLNPMQDWAQDAERGEGSIDVESDNDIGVS